MVGVKVTKETEVAGVIVYCGGMWAWVGRKCSTDHEKTGPKSQLFSDS